MGSVTKAAVIGPDESAFAFSFNCSAPCPWLVACGHLGCATLVRRLSHEN
jgi:hypothetical protein